MEFDRISFRDLSDEDRVSTIREAYPEAYQDMSDEDIAAAIREKFTVIDDKYQGQLDSLEEEQTIFIGIVIGFLFIWIVPPLALYALGWSIGWVYRGFKQQ